MGADEFSESRAINAFPDGSGERISVQLSFKGTVTLKESDRIKSRIENGIAGAKMLPSVEGRVEACKIIEVMRMIAPQHRMLPYGVFDEVLVPDGMSNILDIRYVSVHFIGPYPISPRQPRQMMHVGGGVLGDYARASSIPESRTA